MKNMKRYMTNEDIQMAKKHMKAWLTPLAIREAQIKTTMSHDYTSIKVVF